MKPILEIQNVWKAYKIGQQRQRYLSLRDSLVNSLRFRTSKKETFWALQDVSFEVQEGECVGIIGRNGAGKSTLLKILSKITPPTKGRIIARGRVASLLEVGTGFHPELTGRENIYLNGSILGLKRVEINRKFDEIVDFSGVQQFLDTPLKHYSSGMQLRLAFSVAAHLEPEILLIDEVLAVGDAEFQKKCLGKMDEVSKSGRTVLFVSHNMGAVRQLCERSILLKQGKVAGNGTTNSIIDFYETESSSNLLETLKFEGPLHEKVALNKICINGKNASGGNLSVSSLQLVNIEVFLTIKNLKEFRVTLSLYKEGVRLFSLQDTKAARSPEGAIKSVFQIPAEFLRPGRYSVAVGGHENNKFGDWFWKENICDFSVLEEWNERLESINIGLINLKTHTKRIHL